MEYFAGLDVSVKDTSVCIVDDTGRIVREVKVASEPAALLAVLTNPAYRPVWTGASSLFLFPRLRKGNVADWHERTAADVRCSVAPQEAHGELRDYPRRRSAIAQVIGFAHSSNKRHLIIKSRN